MRLSRTSRLLANGAGLLSFLLVATASPASGQTQAVTFTPGSGSSAGNNNQAVGWQFDLTSGVTVNGLGWYDDGGDGLSVAHEVGIWNSSGTLLFSTTIPSLTGASLNGIFRTVGIPDFFLASGTGYIIGGLNSTSSTDFLSFDVSGLAFHPAISFIDATFSNITGVLERPTRFSSATTGFFGPGFTIADATSTVPEPATMTLLATGLAGMAAARRKKRRA